MLNCSKSFEWQNDQSICSGDVASDCKRVRRLGKSRTDDDLESSKTFPVRRRAALFKHNTDSVTTGWIALLLGSKESVIRQQIPSLVQSPWSMR